MALRLIKPSGTWFSVGGVVAVAVANAACNLITGAQDVVFRRSPEEAVGGGGGIDGGETGGGTPGGGGGGSDEPVGGATGGPCAPDGTDTTGHCAATCGADPPCEGLVPQTSLPSCQAAGHSAIGDYCDESCRAGDAPGLLCQAVGTYDCQGDPECAGAPPGTGPCDANCGYGDPSCPSTSGSVRVLLDGNELFHYGTAKSLECLNLHFTTDQYGDGPSGASIVVTNQQPGLLEANLVGFKDDHGNCSEKWGFLWLKGHCTDVLLEKWNWNPCNTEYQTDRLKLETWVDVDDDCSYSHAENTEPMGGHVSWDPNHVYALRVEWQ